MRFIPTKIHAVLDYLSVVTLLALPRLLHWDARLTSVLTILALGTFVYTLLTCFEGGVARVLPTKVHLIIDFIAGAGLSSLPFWLSTDVSSTTKAVLVGTGLFEVVVSLLTHTHSSVETSDVRGNISSGHATSTR